MDTADLIEAYLNHGVATRGWGDSYCTSQRSTLHRWVATTHPHGLSHLTKTDLTNIAGQVRRSVSAATAKRVFGCLQRFWNYLVSNGVVPAWQGEVVSEFRVRLPKHTGASVTDIPSADDVETLCRFLPAPLDTAARLCTYTGLRLGECFALQPKDISTDGRIQVVRQVTHISGEPHVKAPKYDRTRTVLVPQFLLREVRAVVATGPGGLVFPARSGGYIKPTTLYRVNFTPARERARWPKDSGKWRWNWHSLRDHFCTWALNRGLSVADVAQLAGHASPETTLRSYVGIQGDAVDTARKVL